MYFCVHVTVSEPLGDFYVLTVHSRELCHLAHSPGSLSMCSCGEKTLRRPISIRDVEGDETHHGL